jgi:hypothetical protein
MKVRLTKKLAECIDGVELSNHRVGDILDLPPTDARLLLAEEWAVPYSRTRKEPSSGRSPASRRSDSQRILTT